MAGMNEPEPTVVTVRGCHQASFPAERGTVTVEVGFEGPERDAVVTSTTQGTAALLAGVRLREDPETGSVTWFSTDSLRVWAQRPWSQDGVQLPLVHHAATRTRVKFREVAALAQWVEAASRYDGVRVLGIAWTLTEATRAAVVADVRARAVRDARARAQTYAAALDLSLGPCLALADSGMLGDRSGQAHPTAGVAAMTRAAGDDHEDALAFTPEDIEIVASVDARFLAR